MKKTINPALLLGLLYLSFLGYLAISGGQLPERVATHFDGSGQPDDWMSRSSHLLFTALFGLAFPSFVIAICFLLRFVPAGFCNLPRRDYWLAPERRAETFDYLFRHSLWFGCMAVCFVAGMHFLVITANNQSPVRLSTPAVLLLAGSFLGGVVIWIVRLVQHFSAAGSQEHGPAAKFFPNP